MGDKENKMYYDSYQELKTDVEWLCEHVFKAFKYYHANDNI